MALRSHLDGVFEVGFWRLERAFGAKSLGRTRGVREARSGLNWGQIHGAVSLLGYGRRARDFGENSPIKSGVEPEPLGEPGLELAVNREGVQLRAWAAQHMRATGVAATFLKPRCLGLTGPST